ncbi:hypothetical protein [Rhizobacter sp. Root1221]|uniref:hypothetical protein n=1 Tax=Rhizobacter sp. Root1221 TaxID=1736433 RepID=UPI0006F32D08|nr:hypothetical protein [Rhizobacter sp. Root1221]KQW02328.1 hypothetical protein ASC87_14000 [Rhizobacter sp. Root1221]
MVTAPIDAPSPGLGLFDRLAAGAAAPEMNGADRSRLRPLQPYHLDSPPEVGTAEDDGPPDRVAPSWAPPMRHPPGTTGQQGTVATQRMPDGPAAHATRDATAPSEQHAISEARPTHAHDATPSGVRTTSSSHAVQPSQPTAAALAQARSPVEQGNRAPDILPRRSALESAAHREPRQEPQDRPAMPRPQAFPEPARAALRSRDASPVSPLPRPAPMRAEPTIEIHIGRIEVRAQTAPSPSAAPAPRAAAPSTSSLAAHLGARGRGARS